MKATNFHLGEYLKRIGFHEKPKADIDTVKKIMKRQLRSVPFENLDVQAGKIVSMVPEEIVEKIVGKNRGGYCYEVNGIFAMVLEALNIPYYFVAARPMFYPVKRPKTHMAVVISLEETSWLCDLGFGSYGIREPLRLDLLDAPVKQDHDTFRLVRTPQKAFLLQARVKDEWASQYEFHLHPQEWIDFYPANYLNSTHPDTVFVQKLLVVLHTEDGRKLLFGDSFKKTSQGVESQSSVDDKSVKKILFDEFGLNS